MNSATTKPHKFFIANTAFYANNKGVEALTKASIDIIREHYPNAEIIIWQTPPEGMDIDTDYVVRCKGVTIYKEKNIPFFLVNTVLYVFLLLVRKLFRLNIRYGLVHDMTSSNIIINLNYGDLFTNVHYGKMWYLVILSNILLVLSRKPIILFPQTIGPFEGKFAKIIAKKLMNSSTAIMIREKYSKDILTKTLMIDINKIFLVPDVAFLLKPSPKKRVDEILRAENIPKNVQKPLIGLILNPFLREKKIFKMMLNTTRFIEKNLNGTVILISHGTSQNKQYDGGTYNSLVENSLKRYGCQRVFSIKGRYSAEETKGLIGICDVIVTFPTHPAIFAFSMGVLPIALCFSHKTVGIFEAFSLKKYVIMLPKSIGTTFEGRLMNLIRELVRNKSSIKKKLLIEYSKKVKTILNAAENLLKNII